MRLVAAVATLLALVPAALAGSDPRAEQERLTAADMALARKATLRPGDLPAGWRQFSVGAQEGEVPTCPGYAPDFSRFTITGKSQSAFQHPAGSSILSHVEVYESRADAVGDFRLATQPAVARCLKKLLDEAFAQGGPVTAKVVSSRQVAAPRVGERAAAYRLVAEIAAAGTAVKVYIDVIVVQRGRSAVALFFTGAFEPVDGRAALARVVSARLR